MSTVACYVDSVLAAEPCSRPVLCDGILDQPPDVMLLGHNPGLKSPPLREFWDGDSCDRQGWLNSWKWGPARTRMENSLIPCLSGLRIIECNLSHFSSKSYTSLPNSKRKTDVFENLVGHLKPKVIVTFGKHSREHFAPDGTKGVFVNATIQNHDLEVFLADHLIMGGAAFWQGDRFETLGRRAREICRK